MPMVVPSDAPREVHEMARISRINLIAIVVKALVESLYVDNFRAPDLPDNELPQLTPEQLAAGEAPDDAEDPLGEVWRAWQANKLDRGQGGLYRAVFTYGYGYVAVTPGSPYPVARAVSGGATGTGSTTARASTTCAVTVRAAGRCRPKDRRTASTTAP
jgi:hypothetical protein